MFQKIRHVSQYAEKLKLSDHRTALGCPGVPPGKKGGASGNKVAEPIPLEEAWGGCVAAGVRMAAGGLVGEWSRCGERSCLTTVGLVATLPEEVG
jgi:hypothetical protein